MTKKNASPPKPDSISSEQTDGSVRSNGVLTLGRKLVEELGLESSVDTLGRWMAHYIADLITKVESTTGEEKGLAEEKCFNTVLELWKHRAELPNGKRPFEDLEPVIRVIESLDPENDSPRYFRSARPPDGEDEEKSENDRWFELVDGLDYSAKVLIGYCLAEAARAAVDKSKKWVKLAEAAGAEGGVSEIVIRYVSTAADLGKAPDLNVEARRRLQNRLNRLEGFSKLAKVLARELKAQLEALPPPTEGDEGHRFHRRGTHK